MRILVCLIACAVILISAQSSTLAQGARRGYTITDLDNPGGGGNRIYRIDIDNPQGTIAKCLTCVEQELEGLFSIDNFSVVGRSNLFGVAEVLDSTACCSPSTLVEITAAAVCSLNGCGREVGLTFINFGTEAGSAWDHTTNTVYSIASEDRTISFPGQQYPATALYIIDPSTGMLTSQLSIAQGRYLDGLAVGGDGTLFATDARLTDSLYRYNFDTTQWELVGAFGTGENFGEDTGLANYRGVSGSETNLYMITEGDGVARLGRLWTVNASTGALSPVDGPDGTNQIRLTDGTEVPEDLEGFDIPWLPLVGE
jgi:hypothetical protein